MEEIIKLFNEKGKNYDDLELIEITESKNNYVGWFARKDQEESQDLPILVFDKKTREIEEVIIPPNAIDEEKTVWVKREKSFGKFSKGKEK